MPDVGSTRVKNTGYGELDYAQNSSANSATTAADTGATGPEPVTSVNGENIGPGAGIFFGTNGGSNIMLEFKTLRGGTGVTITDDGQTLTINVANASGGGNGTVISDGFALDLGNTVALPGAADLTANTSVSNAIGELNSILGLLVPAAPPTFPNGSLSIINTSGSIPLLASGVLDHANSTITAGQAVTRTIANPNSNTFGGVGPGDHGDVQLLVNGGIAADVTLTGSDGGTYNGLVIANQGPFPQAQPGFHTSMDLSIVGAVSLTGINKIQITDSGAGNTNTLFFVKDDIVSVPTITTGSVAQATVGTLSYSSSVPHYGTGAALTVGASFTNLSGQTYYGGSDPFVVSLFNGSTNIVTQVFTYSGIGVSTPIAHSTTSATAIVPVTFNLTATTHGQGVVQAVAKNVNGPSVANTIASTIILIKNGSVPSGKIDELNVPVTGLGAAPNTNAAVRVGVASAGDTPATTPTTWVPASAIQPYDATVVAGVLKNDLTNYSTGYLPVGPNLSGQSAAQYVTFSFQRSAVSTFHINVAGSYTGVWVKLPGVSDNSVISPHAANGWWDATKLYLGAGVPGNSSDTQAGCALGTAMNGSGGAFSITFGTQTSTNATGNTILVRIRLNAGQSITSLSFSN